MQRECFRGCNRNGYQGRKEIFALSCNADCIRGGERVPSGLYVGEVILWIEDL